MTAKDNTALLYDVLVYLIEKEEDEKLPDQNLLTATQGKAERDDNARKEQDSQAKN